MKALFFAEPAEWRAWLAKHHTTAADVIVGFWKRATGKPSLTWPQSVDGALCFGWIDGVRRSLGADAYQIRFTPRRAGSNWSLINVRRMNELIAEGQVVEAGLAAFRARDEARTGRYSYEREHAAFTPAELRALRADRAAWADWQARPPGYRKVVTYWVTSAKRDETRARRLAQLIEASAAGRPIGPMLQAEKYAAVRSPAKKPTARAAPKARAPARARPAPARRRSASTRG